LARNWALVEMATDKLAKAGIKTLGNVLVDVKLEAQVLHAGFYKSRGEGPDNGLQG